MEKSDAGQPGVRGQGTRLHGFTVAFASGDLSSHLKRVQSTSYEEVFEFEDGSETCGAAVEVLAGAVGGETGSIELAGHLDCSSASERESCLAVGAALNDGPPTATVT